MLSLPVTYFIISFVLIKFAMLVLRGANPKPFLGEVSRNRRHRVRKCCEAYPSLDFCRGKHCVISSLPQFQIPSLLISLPRTHLQLHSSNTLTPFLILLLPLYLRLQWRLRGYGDHNYDYSRGDVNFPR